MASTKIAIVGAGPAGCTLALLLHRAGFPCTIFEGEADANARNQGGTLDLHDNSGLAAIKKAGLADEFNRFARYDGEALKISNKNLRIFLNMGGAKPGTTTGRPEIDRAQLRTLLSEALPAGTIRWNHHLKRVDASDPTNITLHFANGAALSGFDLVVGADGAWSKIRPLLTTLRPTYSGLIMFRLSITNASARHPDLHKLVNRGSIFSFGSGKGIFAQQLGDGSINVSVAIPADETLPKTLTVDDTLTDLERTKQYLLSTHFRDWAPELRALIQATDTHPPWAAPLYSLPPGTRWSHRPGVTLIGDAAHLMVPFAGEGVNESMLDSLELAERIVAARTASAPHSAGKGASPADVTLDPHVLSAQVRAYEERMFVRAGRTAQDSWDRMSLMFYTTGAPDETIADWIASAVADRLPWPLGSMVTRMIRGYFGYLAWRYPGDGRFPELE